MPNENQAEVKTKKCPDCKGRGINPEVDEQHVCGTCEGSGRVPVTSK